MKRRGWAQACEMFQGVEPVHESAGTPVTAIVVVLIFFGLIVSAPLLGSFTDKKEVR